MGVAYLMTVGVLVGQGLTVTLPQTILLDGDPIYLSVVGHLVGQSQGSQPSLLATLRDDDDQVVSMHALVSQSEIDTYALPSLPDAGDYQLLLSSEHETWSVAITVIPIPAVNDYESREVELSSLQANVEPYTSAHTVCPETAADGTLTYRLVADSDYLPQGKTIAVQESNQLAIRPTDPSITNYLVLDMTTFRPIKVSKQGDQSHILLSGDILGHSLIGVNPLTNAPIPLEIDLTQVNATKVVESHLPIDDLQYQLVAERLATQKVRPLQSPLSSQSSSQLTSQLTLPPPESGSLPKPSNVYDLGEYIEFDNMRDLIEEVVKGLVIYESDSEVRSYLTKVQSQKSIGQPLYFIDHCLVTLADVLALEQSKVSQIRIHRDVKPLTLSLGPTSGKGLIHVTTHEPTPCHSHTILPLPLSPTDYSPSEPLSIVPAISVADDETTLGKCYQHNERLGNFEVIEVYQQRTETQLIQATISVQPNDKRTQIPKPKN